MIRKYMTWVIPTKELEKFTTEEETKLEKIIGEDITDLLELINDGVPVSFKISNIEREYD